MAKPLSADTLIVKTVIELASAAGQSIMPLAVDPTAGGGVAAPVGSIGLRNNGTLYVKTAAGNTAWSALAASSAIPTIVPQQLKTPKFDGANSTAQLSTNGARVHFLGYAYRAFAAGETFTARWRNATAGNTFTWGEMAIGTGTLVPGSNPSVTPVGFADVTAGYSATNTNVTTTISIAVGQAIAAGAGLWLIFAKASTGSPTLASSSAFDQTQSGIQATSATAGWRPSAQLGVAETFTTDTSLLPFLAEVSAPFP